MFLNEIESIFLHCRLATNYENSDYYDYYSYENITGDNDDYAYPEETDPDENSYEEEEYILPENRTILDVYDAVVDNATISPTDDTTRVLMFIRPKQGILEFQHWVHKWSFHW